MKKIMMVIALLTLLSKITGFLRDITLSYFFGASEISDAYLIALTIPGIIFSFIGVAISTSFIPLYNQVVEEKGAAQAQIFMNNLINMMLILCTAIVCLCLIFAEPAVRLFALGFKGDTFETAVLYSRICVVGVYFTGLTYIFSGYLQSHKSFVAPVLVGIPFNLITITFIGLGHYYHNLFLPLGSVVALALQLAIIVVVAYRKGYRYRWTFEVKDPVIRKMCYLFFPLIMGVSISQINLLVDKTIASQIAVGGISALNYANKLNLFIQGIFVLSISTVLYPRISKLAAENQFNQLNEAVKEAVVSMSLLVFPAAIGAMIFAEPIIRILFGHGAFSEDAIRLTSGALMYFSLGMLAFGLVDILSKVFFALQDTRTPMINASISLMLNIALNLILPRYMGLNGIALSTTIAAFASVALMIMSLKQKLGDFNFKEIANALCKIALTSVLMGSIAYGSYVTLKLWMSSEAVLLISILLGAVSYLFVISKMKIKDVELVIHALRSKMGFES